MEVLVFFVFLKQEKYFENVSFPRHHLSLAKKRLSFFLLPLNIKMSLKVPSENMRAP